MSFHLPKLHLRYWLAGIAVVALVALVYFLMFAQRESSPGYTMVPLAYGNIIQTVSANGTLNPVTIVQVGSQVSGTVQQLFVDFNSRVRRGQELARLDPTLFKARIAQDTANLHSAQATLALYQLDEQRARKLRESGYVSQQDLDHAVANVRTSRAQVEAAGAQLRQDQTNLDYSVIRSPVDGVIIDRTVDVGQTVAASFQTPTLFRIGENLRNMRINVTVDEADVGLIEPGQEVRFNVDAYPNQSFVGKVVQVRLNATVQQNVVTYDVVVAVDNADGKLLPSMTAYANIVVRERRGVLVAPNAALRVRIPGVERATTGALGSGVLYVLEDGKPRGVPVETGASDAQHTEIVAGAVKAGVQVVTATHGTAAPPTRQPFRMF